MAKIILTKGIQGSGKSFWAKQFVADDPNYIRVCRDDLRNMRGRYWLPKQEKLITKWEKFAVKAALNAGYSVVVDSMNLNPATFNSWKEFARAEGVQFEVKDFTNIPLSKCIENDLKRPNSLGAKVLTETYNKYLAPVLKIEKPQYIDGAESATICDLDGTLCLFGDKNPYERDFTADDLNGSVSIVLNSLKQNPHQRVKIILFSGRMDKFRDQTEQWLAKHHVPYDELHMRKTGDNRKDSVIKLELYEAHIKGRYNVIAVIDDRLQVARQWHRLGLPLFRVGDPEADF